MSLLLALGVTAQPRAGSSSQYQRVSARQQLDLSFYAINLALTAARAPFAQRDWPNRQAQRPFSFATSDADRTYAPIVSPFAQDDWPNPRAARRAAQDHIAATNLGLLRPEVNPAKQYDWPNPRLGWRNQDFVASTNLGLLRPDVSPAKQYNWPNPRLGWRNPDWIAGTNLGLLRPDVSPFGQDDWPNQLRASWRLQDWSQQGIRAVVVAQPPFAQYDWPNSLAARRSIDLLTWLSTYAFETPVVVTNPFSQRDWPNRPLQRPFSFATTDADRTYAPVVIAGTPFAQTSWPNPRGSVNLAGYQKFLDYITLEIIPPEGNQRNWPNPRGARAVNLAASHPDRSYTVTVVVTGDPIRPIEWANPRGRPDLSRYQKFIDYLSFVTPVAIPPGAATLVPTWGRSRGSERAIDLYGFARGTNALNLPTAVNPPIRQYDWPTVPAAKRQIQLYGWIQALYALQLPAIVNPPIRQYDWPNPRGPQHTDRLGWLGPLGARDIPEGPPPIVIQPGGDSVPHTFSRKRWRELQMLIAAEMAAVAKAERLTKESKREPLLKAARAAAAAVDAAEAEGENARLDKLLVRNAETIRRAIRAATAVGQAREVASAIEQSRAIVLRQKEDEEDEMIALLMMS